MPFPREEGEGHFSVPGTVFFFVLSGFFLKVVTLSDSKKTGTQQYST